MYLGIDSGGSKTMMVLLNREGEILHQGQCEGVGRSVDDGSNLLSELTLPLSNLRDQYGFPMAICVNLGGKNSIQIHRTVTSVFPMAKIHVYRESEGVVPLFMARREEAEIIVLAGTGAIALGYSGAGEEAVSGGWGQDISDEGSGYWVGMETIRSILKSVERETPTLLAGLVLNSIYSRCGTGQLRTAMETRDEIRGKLPRERGSIAAVSRLTAKAAEMGDAEAERIFAEAGRKLAELTYSCAEALQLDKTPFRVLLAGGMTNCMGLWEEAYAERLRELCSTASYRRSQLQLSYGAALLARQLHDKKEE